MGHLSNWRPPEAKCGLKNGFKMIFWTYEAVSRPLAASNLKNNMPEMSSATPKPLKIHITWLYFQTVLAASGGLDATLGGYHYSKPLEDDRNGFSNSKKNLEMTYHIYQIGGRLRPNAASKMASRWFFEHKHIWGSFEAAIGHWRPSIWKMSHSASY